MHLQGTVEIVTGRGRGLGLPEELQRPDAPR
jgi:hypothetical protein